MTETEHFTHEELDCKIRYANHLADGHWCGYVQIPDDLGPVRWTSDYDSKHNEVLEAEVDVHGGISYGPDEDGWVGFDDGHSKALIDTCPSDEPKHAVKLETQRLAEQINQLAEDDE